MAGEREWTLKRNCSISPRQLLLAYCALCGVSLAIASFFTWRGAWYVLAFAVMEMLAVGIAFLLFARHATDREVIALDGDWLRIELIEAERSRTFRLDPRATRIEIPAAHYRLIAVEQHGTRVEIGRFLTAFKRQQFARELRSALVGL
ncbi:MAG: DUF2244 domain-containing protein [Herminiimonas sp.]|nr:DUF2244 domain-containing protein [Herminiimonas sp.]